MATPIDFKRRIGGGLQFRLRTLLLAVTVCGIAFAVMNAIGPVWSAVAIFFATLVMLHVVGNALGTRLREEATANAAFDTDPPPVCLAEDLAPPPAKRLALHKPLGWGIAVLTALGALGAGTLGEILFTGHATHAGVIVGTISAGVLGGFAAFVASSFLRVGLAALWQAHCDKPAPATRERPES